MTRQTEVIIFFDESSSPSADDYIIDADRSTLRLSTGYPNFRFIRFEKATTRLFLSFPFLA